ncbi:hypothetical protein SVIOM342S_03271 [Streptomyces violaceorubidus]
MTEEPPFVTVLSGIGVPAAGDVMNLVVVTAAMSSLNSGLYSTGRILRSMAMAGSAPRFTGVMSRSQVPYGGILLTCAVCVLGVGLNYLVPSKAFEIVLNVALPGHACPHLGDHHDLPPGVRPPGAGEPGRTAALPAARQPHHGDRHDRPSCWLSSA